MDEIITNFLKQCEDGRVYIDDVYYNLHFSLNSSLNCLNIKLEDKELLYKYIKEFLLLFKFENINQIYRKLIYLFSNLTYNDFENIYEYIKRNILFVKNKLLCDNEILFDRTAFIQRDVNACINNINALLIQYNVLQTDSDYIKKYLKNYLEFLFQDKDNLKIAFFPRYEINRDFSDNYDKATMMQGELSVEELFKIALKPSFEIDRHQNTTYDSSIISSITIPNYAKSLIKKRN